MPIWDDLSRKALRAPVAFRRYGGDRKGRVVTAIESANVLWFIPTHGDGRYLGTSLGGRAVDFAYLKQIAQAADSLGYDGVLLPTGKSCEDSWVVASALAPLTERLRFWSRCGRACNRPRSRRA